MAALLSLPYRRDEEFISGFSPAATSCNGFGRSVSSESPEASDGSGGETIHVAVGKSVEKMVALLRWTFSTFPGQEICLLHVHRPSSLIPTLLGKLPVSQANPHMVAVFRSEEREEMMKLLSTYLKTCSQSKVKASVIAAEADEVQKGIVSLVNQRCIRKLVIGAIPDSVKGKKTSRKASYAAKHTPSYCEIWFVNKGKLICTRTASGRPLLLPSYQSAAASNTGQKLIPADSETDKTLLTSSQSAKSTCDPPYSHMLSYSKSSSSGEPRLSSVQSAKSLEESLCFQLVELNVEDDESKYEAYLELLGQKRLEDEALEAFNKVKVLEIAHCREIEIRRGAEDALRTTTQEQEKLLEEREKIAQQLQRTMRHIALMDSRVQEASRRREEVAGELKLIQASIATLRKEKQKLRGQKIEVTRWLHRWRSHEQCEDVNENNSIGLTGDTPELPDFSLLDLEAATCNFSESFQIGQGGYGLVYKGEMLDRTVAIKQLHSCNMQRQTEFHKVVQVLAKLQHPHLVELIGVCSDSWLLIYEYVPGGSLQNHLCNNNINTLNWKVRAQIVADIASGLLFLHSLGREKIVHGNLKPENILLDFEKRCKISDYGDHMLTASQSFRCPSFRQCTGSSGALMYTDPESHRTAAPSHKSDIYSFGLIILQLVTGKNHGGLIGEVRRAVFNGKVASILDMSAGEWSAYVARRLVELGLQCCESNSRDRPELTPSLVTELERMPFLEEQIVPSFFLCPILQEIMHDPQVAADGFTYEGEALQEWLGNGNDTSPMTNLKLSHLNLTPNHSLRLAIQDWISNLKITS